MSYYDGAKAVSGELLSEGIIEPTLMPLRGRVKLFCSEIDSPHLFKLDSDADELTDVLHHAAYAETLDAMLSVARALWDAKALRDRIRKDQNRPPLINRSYKIGSAPVRDYQPHEDASKQHVRTGGLQR